MYIINLLWLTSKNYDAYFILSNALDSCARAIKLYRCEKYWCLVESHFVLLFWSNLEQNVGTNVRSPPSVIWNPFVRKLCYPTEADNIMANWDTLCYYSDPTWNRMWEQSVQASTQCKEIDLLMNCLNKAMAIAIGLMELFSVNFPVQSTCVLKCMVASFYIQHHLCLGFFGRLVLFMVLLYDFVTSRWNFLCNARVRSSI